MWVILIITFAQALTIDVFAWKWVFLGEKGLFLMFFILCFLFIVHGVCFGFVCGIACLM
jgi:hypothetical protein